LKLFQGSIRGTASPPPGAPPQGLAAFYWHFIRQARGWFAALFAASLARARPEAWAFRRRQPRTAEA
jgi:ATP-binding cassette subfamily B multidrug efflux pump